MNTPKGVETIFAETLRLLPEERVAYLDQFTNDDPELRRRVEMLLASYEAGDFLEKAAAPQMHPMLTITIPLSEKPGDTIGRYKLLQKIGEGGCGVVYMAEQAEPVRRRVALKIIKLGMDTKSVIARFEAERQALALMDHPNIAKVFDAGATETGRPYFVMELVRGMKLTDYCDEVKLPTRARLDLFIQVCQAIQHAHQKGIIHRDIKPSNILVTVNDGVPVPKVIDFGIAKATSGQQLTDKTLFTAFEQFIGTPAYMSPEQAVLTSLDIDTRSDIYALGVLLYELLTGKTPFDAKALMAIGLDEMRRTIREQEPQRPSTRLSTLPGQELSTTAQRRGLEAPKLVSELRGDLDWIVMKALEKDRARRYETANGLAMDIQRHMNHEPVVACPPSRIYRFKKMVRRNKLAFTAGSAVAASLVIGLTLATVLFFRERLARARADEQTAIAQAVNEFLQGDLLRQADSRIQAEARFTPNPNLTVREALERAAERIGDRFKDQPLQEAAIRMSIGEAFIGLGEAQRAIPHVQRARALRQAKLGPDHPATLNSMGVLVWAYLAAGQLDTALPLGEETLKLRKARLGPDDPDTLYSMNNLASVYQALGKLDQALLLREETLKLRQAKLGPDDPQTLGSMNNLASAYRQVGKLDQAVALYQNTLQLMQTKLTPGHPYTLNTMGNLAAAYQEAGMFEQALPLHREALKFRQASQRPDHPDTLATMSRLGMCFEAMKNYSEAETVYRELLSRLRPPSGNAPPREVPLLGVTLHHLASALQQQRKLLMEARSFAEEAMALYHRHADWPANERQHAFKVLEAVLTELGDSRELKAIHRKQAEALLAAAEKGDVVALDDLEWLLTKWSDSAYALHQQSKLEEAEALFRDVLNHLRPASSNAPPREIPVLGFTLHHLADVLREQKRLGEARASAEKARTLYQRHADWLPLERECSLGVLEAVLKELGDSNEFRAVRLERLEVLRAAAEKDDLSALNNLAWILATSSDSALRDGRSAVGFAERAAVKTERKNPGILDTLAVTYAAAGEFAKAADVQREAIALAWNEKQKSDYAARLKLYQSNTPYREP